MPSKNKSAKISITLPANEKKEWQQLAEEADKSLSRFIVDIVRSQTRAGGVEIKVGKGSDLEVLREGIADAKKKVRPKISHEIKEVTDKSLSELIGEYVKEED